VEKNRPEAPIPSLPEEALKSISALQTHIAANKVDLLVKCHVCFGMTEVGRIMENTFTMCDSNNGSDDGTNAPKLCTSCEEGVIAIR